MSGLEVDLRTDVYSLGVLLPHGLGGWFGFVAMVGSGSRVMIDD